MALVAIASLIGRAAFRAVIHDVASVLSGDNIARQSLMDYAQKLEATAKPEVLGIASETWYAFRLANENDWRRANQLLADSLKLEIPRTYFRHTKRPGALPYVLSIHPTREGLLCNFRRAPRSTGFDSAELRAATVDAVRGVMKTYIRMAASGQMVGD